MQRRAGILFFFFLLLANGVAALGQVRGEVESVGFGPEGFYRPTCWTPMLVRLAPTSPEPFKGQIIVKQDDLDGDHVTYREDFEIGGTHEGGSEGQRYWMYFLPSPKLQEAGSGAELTRQLQVFVCDKNGKELVQLPITCNGIRNIDTRMMGTAYARGRRLLLCVTRDDKPELSGYADAIGISEDVQPVMLGEGSLASLLPENPIGYQAVDAVLWCNADPNKLTDKQRVALKQWIGRGGRLVILQATRGTQWATESAGLGDLMPVTVKNIVPLPKLDLFKLITQQSIARTYTGKDERARRDFLQSIEPGKWDQLRGSDVAVGEPKPGAVVDRWVADIEPAAPFIVRQPYGLGAVTWVAMDIADPNLKQRTDDFTIDDDWSLVWDRIFDYANDTIPRHRFSFKEGLQVDKAADRLQPSQVVGSSGVHLEHSFLTGMELSGTGTTLVGVAILFFIAYWAIGGPGAYFFLRYRKKASLNWFAFTVVALGATLVTVGIVKLVLRGSPQVRHVSFVRLGADGTGWARSQFGLYIPRDGFQKIALKHDETGGKEPEGINYIAPFTPPRADDLATFSAHQDYEITVDHASTVEIPYRSTLKKLQAAWSGRLPSVSANAALDKDGMLGGLMVNNTGRTLQNVYIVYTRRVSPDRLTEDQMYYVSKWDTGTTIDLKDVVNRARGHAINNNTGPDPRGTVPQEGVLDHTAEDPGIWGEALQSLWGRRGWNEQTTLDDLEEPAPRSFVILSLYNHFPIVNPKGDEHFRPELLRLGLRFLDVSPDLSAGSLVVLAQASGDLPMPLEVDGRPLQGDGVKGVTFYQFIFPLDRSAHALTPPPPPATKPATTRAATEQATTAPTPAR